MLDGTADVWVDGVHETLEAGDLALILAPFTRHGFSNVGEDTLHVLAVFSTPAPEAVYDVDSDHVVEIGGTDGDTVDATRTSHLRT